MFYHKTNKFCITTNCEFFITKQSDFLPHNFLTQTNCFFNTKSFKLLCYNVVTQILLESNEIFITQNSGFWYLEF